MELVTALTIAAAIAVVAYLHGYNRGHAAGANAYREGIQTERIRESAARWEYRQSRPIGRLTLVQESGDIK